MKNLLNLGRTLNRTEQQSITGGFAWTTFKEGRTVCLDCSGVITWEDDPTDDDFMQAECNEVAC